VEPTLLPAVLIDSLSDALWTAELHLETRGCHFLITTTSRAIRLIDYCRAYTEIGWLPRRD
jgi:hypothetical protein